MVSESEDGDYAYSSEEDEGMEENGGSDNDNDDDAMSHENNAAGISYWDKDNPNAAPISQGKSPGT
jgi:hypothetical protein